MANKVLIVIPCYNEEASLPSVLEELKQTTLPGGYQLDALVVNDCSKDNTVAVAKKGGAIVIDLPVNLGIGGAVQTGILYARDNEYDMVIQLDGDGQHPPQLPAPTPAEPTEHGHPRQAPA